jgi:hypothetical protein
VRRKLHAVRAVSNGVRSRRGDKRAFRLAAPEPVPEREKVLTMSGLLSLPPVAAGRVAGVSGAKIVTTSRQSSMRIDNCPTRRRGHQINSYREIMGRFI